MKKILVAYKVTSIGKKEFEVPDDFDIDNYESVIELLEDYGEVLLFRDSELDEIDYEDVYEIL